MFFPADISAESLGKELLSPWIFVFNFLVNNAKPFSKVVFLFILSPAGCEDACCSTSLLPLGIVHLLHFSYLHYEFYFAFP